MGVRGKLHDRAVNLSTPVENTKFKSHHVHPNYGILSQTKVGNRHLGSNCLRWSDKGVSLSGVTTEGKCWMGVCFWGGLPIPGKHLGVGRGPWQGCSRQAYWFQGCGGRGCTLDDTTRTIATGTSLGGNSYQFGSPLQPPVKQQTICVKALTITIKVTFLPYCAPLEK